MDIPHAVAFAITDLVKKTDLFNTKFVLFENVNFSLEVTWSRDENVGYGVLTLDLLNPKIKIEFTLHDKDKDYLNDYLTFNLYHIEQAIQWHDTNKKGKELAEKERQLEFLP